VYSGGLYAGGLRIDSGDRFWHGVERGEVRAATLDGRVYKFRISNVEAPQSRVRALQDSLVAQYGPPTHKIDSLYVIRSGTIPTEVPVLPSESKEETVARAVDRGIIDTREIDTTLSASAVRWDAERTVLILHTREDHSGFSAEIYDKQLLEEVHALRLQIDSTLQTRKRISITSVGDFDLRSTASSPLISSEESSALGETFTTHSIPYDLLQPFFGVENRTLYGSYGSEDLKAIDVDVDLDDKTDSLAALDIRIYNEVPTISTERGYEEIPLISLEEITSLIEERVGGSPSLTLRESGPEHTAVTHVWAGEPFSIVVHKDESEERSQVTFRRTRSPDVNLLLTARHVPRVGGPYLLPWPSMDDA
jgi:hypothetical protein